MTNQIFGIYPWLALIALLLRGRRSKPEAGAGS